MNEVRFPPAKEQANGRLNLAPAGNGIQRLMVWHRRLGLAAAVIVLLLAITGLLLNHAHRLGLDQAQVTASWLLKWYGFPTSNKALSYRAGDRWLSWTGARLYLDDKPVVETTVAPVGAVATADGMLAVAFPGMLVVLASDGAVVERIGLESLPGTVERLAVGAGGLVAVTTARGHFLADADLTTWRPASARANWSIPQEAPAALRERLLTAERGPGLLAERVLQDLHSGRIFGPWGPWLMDAAAIAFVIMALTGIFYWWRRRARTQKWPPNHFDRRNGE